MRRLIVFFGGSVLAWVILVIGILSPLTPSKGYPEPIKLFFFIGVPIILLSLLVWYGKHFIIRTIGVIQIIMVLWISKWLLVDVLHHPWFKWFG